MAAFTEQRLREQAGEATSQSSGGWCKRPPSPGALLRTWEGREGPAGAGSRQRRRRREDAVTEGPCGPERDPFLGNVIYITFAC